MDPFNLQRFVDAQSPIYQAVLNELRSGCKRSHWMWFIFPQIKGLGQSETARKFSICSCEEAGAYLNHSILGARLRECTNFVNMIEGLSAREIFGTPDDMKFRSCMTLFGAISNNNTLFEESIKKYFNGVADERTIELL